MVRVRAPCGKVAFALYVLFGIVDAFEFCMVYWASLALFSSVWFIGHLWLFNSVWFIGHLCHVLAAYK